MELSISLNTGDTSYESAAGGENSLSCLRDCLVICAYGILNSRIKDLYDIW